MMAWVRLADGRPARLTQAQTRILSRLLVCGIVTSNGNRLRTLATLEDLGLVEQTVDDQWELTGHGRTIALELESRR
ncbi:hypothetical protein JS533_001555 [Bifidobacterium amazonense]|uniref:ArsR family transcriptional regulator n=1 Tax=Bifidobacterium amazonense TaxID=2809027 RepID=A0ABS9VSA8_9BIFI|nr:hypothetical protein [Bifidobacterium amazonense]MCH9274975.1 hypothetical protein [Bifidobacterium amazonense]